jgi:hypothetical protein
MRSTLKVARNHPDKTKARANGPGLVRKKNKMNYIGLDRPQGDLFKIVQIIFSLFYFPWMAGNLFLRDLDLGFREAKRTDHRGAAKRRAAYMIACY